jgi:rhodanese-related sulfurtransferase
MPVPTIFAEDLKQKLDAGDRLYLLDVREEDEFEISNIGGHLIPLSELPKHFHEFDNQTEIVAICKMGTRSARAVEMLLKAGFSKVRNLAGGIHAWSDRVDHSVRKY